MFHDRPRLWGCGASWESLPSKIDGEGAAGYRKPRVEALGFRVKVVSWFMINQDCAVAVDGRGECQAR